MSVVFRAVDAPVAAREDYWRQVLREHMCPMEVQLEGGPGVADTLVRGDLGVIEMVESSAGPGELRRTARHIRRRDPENVQLYVQAGGAAFAGQDDDLTELSPGDLSLVDPARPFRCVQRAARRSIVLTVPRALMPLRRSELDRLVGRPISGRSGTAALLSTLVRQLPSQLDGYGRSDARVGSAVVDLLTAALAAGLDRGSAVPEPSRKRVLLARITAFIEARLGDPALSPTAIAAAHYISVRYLHRLFESNGQSVAGLIRERRLEGSRRDLLDDALAERPVAATAARWGFGTPAHFNRAFRRAYGVPPGEYRRSNLRP